MDWDGRKEMAISGGLGKDMQKEEGRRIRYIKNSMDDR